MLARKKKKKSCIGNQRRSEQEKEPGRSCWRDERPRTSTLKASSSVFFSFRELV